MTRSMLAEQHHLWDNRRTNKSTPAACANRLTVRGLTTGKGWLMSDCNARPAYCEGQDA